MTLEQEIKINDYCRVAGREELTPVFVLLGVEPEVALKVLGLLWDVADSEYAFTRPADAED
jgi:hypothetical protein